MLSSLHIENVAVIRCADIDFRNGFSALTGETGAGKSIIIDSINILTGNRVNRELVRSGENKASVGAVFTGISPVVRDYLSDVGFDCPDDSVMLQKDLYADGRSVARINGKSVTQNMLREVGRRLVNIHGQNDSRALMQQETHLGLLDDYIGDRIGPELAEYKSVYAELAEKKSKLSSLRQSEAEKIRMREMLEYQIKDIDALKLRDGEEELLEKERLRLQNIEKISKQVNFTTRVLSGEEKGSAAYLLDRAATSMQQLSGIIPEAAGFAEKLRTFQYEIIDISESVAGFADEPDGDPEKLLDKIESRLDGITKLKRKYGQTVSEILEFRNNAKTRFDEIEGADKLCEELEADISALDLRADAIAEKISAVRRDAAKTAAKTVSDVLSFLDMPKVRFSISVTPTEKNQDGADRVEFMIATNSGEPLKPLIKIASGGELSRIMLALRCVLNDRDGLDCAIYDEVDTGISGKTSRKVGIKLSEISKRGQVICVTHSAQIASLADFHFRISKSDIDGRTETSVHLLSDRGERIDEIARILGGIEITDAQRAAAEDMLQRKDC